MATKIYSCKPGKKVRKIIVKKCPEQIREEKIRYLKQALGFTMWDEISLKLQRI